MKRYFLVLTLTLWASCVFAFPPEFVGILVSGNAVEEAEPPQTNLYAQWVSTAGITESGGLVSSWVDQKSSIPATQATSAKQPLLTTDAATRAVVSFPNSTSPTTAVLANLDINASFTLPISNSTVWAVTSGSITKDGAVITLGNEGVGYMLSDVANAIPNYPAFETRVASAMPGVGASPYIHGRHSAASGTAYVLDAAGSSANLGSPVSNGLTLTGGSIGRNNRDDNEYLRADIYEILVYTPAQDAQGIADTRAYLKSKYGVKSDGATTEFTSGQIVCEGDSITEGVGAVANLSYPHQLAFLKPNWKVTNVGQAGAMVSGLVSFAARTDAIKSAKYTRNVLMVHIGTNNFSGGSDNGAAVYAELVAYLQARVAAGWEVWAATVIDDDANSASRTTFNALVRSNLITDAGVNRIIDLNANTVFDAGSYTDTTYYNTDGTHPKAAGYAVMAGVIANEM